ncbi:MAG: hypothetical protein IKW58_02995 [Alphaproteobacteria bacterium]|nr:hypothetical protein [Alphaproteobacteria bacterium]
MNGTMQTNKLERILFFFLVFVSLSMWYMHVWLLKSNGDNIEHIHTSWLIWQNKIPYRDFFQHHNPLIWYVFAPIVAGLIDNIKIFQIFNSISFIAFGIMVLYQIKIIKLCKISNLVLYICSFVIITSISVLGSIDYRPDTFMYLLFFGGTYYLLKYLKNFEQKNLVLSFLLYFLSFLCSQKIILNLLMVAFIVIYNLYSNNIKKKDFCLSLLLPFVILCVFLSYLYVNDSLSIYLKSNYYFNTYVPTIFHNNRIVLPPFEYYDFYLFVPIAIIACIHFLVKGNYVEKFLSILFVEELLLRCLYFSAFLHYNLLLLLLAIMLSVLFLNQIKISKKALFIVSLIYICFAFTYNYKKIYQEAYKSKDLITNYEYTFLNTTPCDYVINGYYSVYNLKGKDPSYYSILLGQIDVLGEKLDIAPRPNLNRIIQEYKPKIISGGIYWDTYKEERGIKYPAHIIDMEILNTYYNYTNIGNLFILKPEYQKHNCKYNGRFWFYED